MNTITCSGSEIQLTIMLEQGQFMSLSSYFLIPDLELAAISKLRYSIFRSIEGSSITFSTLLRSQNLIACLTNHSQSPLPRRTPGTKLRFVATSKGMGSVLLAVPILRYYVYCFSTVLLDMNVRLLMARGNLDGLSHFKNKNM